MNSTELKEILDQHKLWLKSDGKEGKRADLRKANLKGANLSKANLSGANLSKADLTYCKNIFSFSLGKDFAFYVKDSRHLQIGCEGHNIDYWLKNYKEIGKGNNYTEEEIEMYGKMISLLVGGKK